MVPFFFVFFFIGIRPFLIGLFRPNLFVYEPISMVLFLSERGCLRDGVILIWSSSDDIITINNITKKRKIKIFKKKIKTDFKKLNATNIKIH